MTNEVEFSGALFINYVMISAANSILVLYLSDDFSVLFGLYVFKELVAFAIASLAG